MITATQLAANSVDSAELVSGGIDTIHLADDAVTTAKITFMVMLQAAKLGVNSVVTTRIADNAITSGVDS